MGTVAAYRDCVAADNLHMPAGEGIPAEDSSHPRKNSYLPEVADYALRTDLEVSRRMKERRLVFLEVY